MKEQERAEPRGLLTVGPRGSIPSLESALSEGDWRRESCCSLVEAFARLAVRPFAAVLIHEDSLPEGTSALQEIRRVRPDATVVVLLNAPRRVEGADECLVMPCDLRELARVLGEGDERRNAGRQIEALARQNERLEEVIRQQRRQLAMIEALGARLGQSVSSQQVLLEAALEVFREACGAQRQSLMLLENGNSQSELRIVASRGVPGDVVSETRCKMGEGVAGWVAKHGRALLSKPEALSVADDSAARPYQSEHFLSLPLRIGDEVIGVLNVTERADGRPFEEEEVRALSILADQVAVLVRSCQRLENAEELSLVDELTQLYNRRYLMQGLQREIQRAKRTKGRFCLAMLDVDSFKLYNDTHGHLAGDRFLRQFADLLQETVRSADTVCRYGGDEFAIILQETGSVSPSWRPYGLPLMHRLRVVVSEFPFEGRESQPGSQVTVSAGLALYPGDGDTAEEMIAAADEMLYKAKSAGRNRVFSRKPS